MLPCAHASNLRLCMTAMQHDHKQNRPHGNHGCRHNRRIQYMLLLAQIKTGNMLDGSDAACVLLAFGGLCSISYKHYADPSMNDAGMRRRSRRWNPQCLHVERQTRKR